MHFLVTGATGFLGSHICHALLDSGHTVLIVKRSTSSLHRILDISESCRLYDIDKVPLESIFKNESIDSIIHTACTYGRADEPINEIIKTNICFPIVLAELAYCNGVTSFINVDTIASSEFESLFALKVTIC